MSTRLLILYLSLIIFASPLALALENPEHFLHSDPNCPICQIQQSQVTIENPHIPLGLCFLGYFVSDFFPRLILLLDVHTPYTRAPPLLCV